MIRCKKNIPFVIAGILIFMVLALYAVMFLDCTLSRHPVETYNFFSVLKYVFSSDVTLKLYGYCLLIIFLGFLVLLTSDTKGYQSNIMKITDEIATPVPAGQGQCGTARWLPKNKFKESFACIEFDANDLEKWQRINLEDIKEELVRIEASGKENLKDKQE